jgi:hypothetical protein
VAQGAECRFSEVTMQEVESNLTFRQRIELARDGGLRQVPEFLQPLDVPRHRLQDVAAGRMTMLLRTERLTRPAF